MSSSAYSTPPQNRRPPLRHSNSSSTIYNSPIRSFSMPITSTTSTSSSSPGSGSSRSSPTTSRRGSWDCEKMSDSNWNEKEKEKEMDLEREIYMGALVSPGGGDWEKSIEVPCIILTEPDHHHRAPTPLRPKQILLLPPTSLPLPLHSSQSTPRRNGWSLVSRAALIICLVGLGGWHLWGVLGGSEREGL